MDEKSRHQIFYRTDTHWNNRGAYVGYREIMNVLCRWFPQLETIPSSAFDEFHVTPSRAETWPSLLGMPAYFADRYCRLADDQAEARP